MMQITQDYFYTYFLRALIIGLRRRFAMKLLQRITYYVPRYPVLLSFALYLSNISR